MVTFKAFFLELLILANYYWYRTQSAETVVFRIGALLSSSAVMDHFNNAANETIQLDDVRIKFVPTSDVMKANAIQATDQVCDLIRDSQRRLSALVVSHPPDHPEQPPLSVSYTAAFFNLPTLGITARQSDFSDKTAHNMFFRTVPPYSQEIIVFKSIMKKLEWDHANVIHSTNNEGRNLLALLQKDNAFKISAHVGIEADANVTQKLLEMSMEQTRLVILYVNADIAEKVFDAATKLGMLRQNWAWLVTEQALKARNVPPGILGVQLSKSLEDEHVQDAVRVVKQGILNAYKKNAYKLKEDLIVDSCKTSLTLMTQNKGAGTLYEYLKAVELTDGVTGGLSFDDRGDRKQARFHIVNKHVNGSFVTVGSYEASGKRTPSHKKGSLSISLNRIYWPGNFRSTITKEICTPLCFQTLIYQPPKSFKKKTFLKVVTQRSIPFMHTRELTADRPCDIKKDPKTLRGEVECTHTDPITGVVKKYCCYGYCVDILRRLANRSDLEGPERPATDFNYELHLVGDGEIGREITDGPDKKKRWTGIIEELASEKADLAVAPMTITPERAAKIEFTKPFKYLGITIIVKRSNPKSNLGSFLQPFDNTLWVLVFLSVHVVALVLYLLDRFSPFGRYKFARGNDGDEDTLNLSSAMWFAWGVLLNSGIGEGTPRSFSARVLGMVWAGFAMIIVASYTANLAAFLVLDRPKAIISGIDDPRLRNPGDFKFATVKDSPVEAYFKTQLEYDTMLRTMQKYVYTTPEEALKDVKSGDLKAFIWDSPRLEFEASSDCDLKTAGEIFGRTGYGLGLRKDSPWFYEMSQAVLNFHESGVMEELDSEWILVKATNCPNLESTASTLGLTNMAGVFIMVAGGIVAGVFLIFIEMAYKKRTGLKEKELELAKNAADRWRGNIEKRKILRKTRAAELLEKDMPLLGMGGVGYSMPSPRYLPNQAMHQDYKRTIQLRNQNGIFAEQPLGRV